MDNELQELHQRFIEMAGNFTQSFGSGRVIGQIFAHLYFCPEAQSLDDLTRELAISKGSASMSVRQLEQWGALHRVWVKGDRKVFYEASDEFGYILRCAVRDSISQRMESADQLLKEANLLLKEKKKSGNLNDEYGKFFKKRLKRFTQFRDRVKWFWDKILQGIL